uniref:Fmp27_GFWDK domain-containing protein n=1 Tax=Macrostomum lignano TaxID=282301 RepID=A0A1I8FBI1_9PLAT
VAESAPSPNSHPIRHRGDLGSPWPNATVIRCMPPLKFFHDARMRLQLAELCYGSNWQPAFDWFNQCFNNILRPTRDRQSAHALSSLDSFSPSSALAHQPHIRPASWHRPSTRSVRRQPRPSGRVQLLHTNALKFSTRLATCLTKVSGRYDRGQIFRQNVGGRGGAGVGGRKPLFGRSLRRLPLESRLFRAPCLSTGYPSLALRACFTMELAGYKDGLKRRPRAQWTASSLTVKIRGVSVTLRQQRSGRPAATAGAVRCGLQSVWQWPGSGTSFSNLQLRGLQRGERFAKPIVYRAKHNVFVKDLKVRWTLEIRNHIFGLINSTRTRWSCARICPLPCLLSSKSLLEERRPGGRGSSLCSSGSASSSASSRQQQQQQQEQHRRTSSVSSTAAGIIEGRSQQPSVGVINAYSESGGGGGGGSNLHFYPANSIAAAPASASGS